MTAQRIAAAIRCTRGVSVIVKPKGVSTRSTTGRVSPCVPPDSDGKSSSAV